MATLYVTEFASVGGSPGMGGVSQAAYDSGSATEQHVAIGGTSTQSSAFGTGTNLIRVHTDAICSIAIGSNPTAVATARRMAANATEYFNVIPGHKIAVITNT